jgi:hypothetical protein
MSAASTGAETFYSRLLWRSRNSCLKLSALYLGTDVLSRYACIIPMDRGGPLRPFWPWRAWPTGASHGKSSTAARADQCRRETSKILASRGVCAGALIVIVGRIGIGAGDVLRCHDVTGAHRLRISIVRIAGDHRATRSIDDFGTRPVQLDRDDLQWLV